MYQGCDTRFDPLALRLKGGQMGTILHQLAFRIDFGQARHGWPAEYATGSRCIREGPVSCQSRIQIHRLRYLQALEGPTSCRPPPTRSHRRRYLQVQQLA